MNLGPRGHGWEINKYTFTYTCTYTYTDTNTVAHTDTDMIYILLVKWIINKKQINK